MGRCSFNTALSTRQGIHITALDLQSPTAMSGSEVARWAQIGKNAVPGFVKAFGIREITGNRQFRKYPVSDVLTNILGTAGGVPADRVLLLVPLLTVTQLAALTGMSESAISARARAMRPDFPVPVQISGSAENNPRGRRWIHAQVNAYLMGLPDPLVAMRKAAGEAGMPAASNVFAQLRPGNAKGSR